MIITYTLKGETEIKYYYLIEVSAGSIKTWQWARGPPTYIFPHVIDPKSEKIKQMYTLITSFSQPAACQY